MGIAALFGPADLPGKIVTSSDRRTVLVSMTALAAALLFDRQTLAQSTDAVAKPSYRGFTVDWSAARDVANFEAIEVSLKHQIDIVADCGATQQIMAFFRSQQIVVKPGQADRGHFYANRRGVTVDAVVDAPEKPVVLHELLHAYHWRVLPGAFRNAESCASTAMPRRARSIHLTPTCSRMCRNSSR